MTRPTPNRARAHIGRGYHISAQSTDREVRHVALLYSRKTRKDGASYWRTTRNRTYDQLRALGLPHDQALAEHAR